jgi:hypothetical protein
VEAAAVAQIRVAAHVHSDWSYDGSWGLSELVRAFGRRGYAALLMAEHDRGFDAQRWAAYRDACAGASTGGVVVVPGIEYSDAANDVHIPVWGDIPFLGEALETGVLLDRAVGIGGLAVLAHPGRRDVWARFTPRWTERLLGVELWNRKYDGIAPGLIGAQALRDASGLVPFVGLDFHTARQFHPLAMLVDVQGPPSEAAICAALQARRCRPTAFRLPATGMAQGPTMRTMRAAERARKAVARPVRSMRAHARIREPQVPPPRDRS